MKPSLYQQISQLELENTQLYLQEETKITKPLILGLEVIM
jgi:hypothetical protein